ncbi:hypothetical protein MPTK1_3g14300 [Marchantia polymorpha subsp. ruderalis]|uniref:Uncharacterized protein n=2 Tax=Marchantia polymorpha TaxID=3197 RepID=A0AAF6B0P0_MARPO|nr:hypothetical protein MARPO_0004s0241 [Marchantia polymorpha]BBN05574.1 hypothetical protein Mp_3g14300 [Marchantia polymorpha subsp. ruderalis]|eukprot:PTQ49008.1 hypothetical protein MARPO_0004s0241 [Marchantia polymorpha]
MGKMTTSRKMPFRLGVVAWICVVLSFVSVGCVVADAGVDLESEVDTGLSKSAPLLKEIDRLKELVGGLEKSLKEKDESLKEKSILLEKKEEHINVIDSELLSLKAEKGYKDTLSKLESELEAALVKAKELESSVLQAQKESQEAEKNVKSWEKRALAAEKSLNDLEAKHEETHKSLLEQRKRAQSAEQTLKIAEAAMLEAETKAHTRTKELLKVTNQWLPHWASTRVGQLQANAVTKWRRHAKPRVELLLKSASQKAAEAQDWAKPHLESVKSSVVPAAQQHWRTLADSLGPHVQTLRSNTLKGYEVVRTEYLGKAQEYVKPHVDTIVEASRPYVGMIQEHTRPYVDQISTLTKPYLDQARQIVNPYVEKAAPYYRDAVSAAVRHHKNLQETVRSNLAKHDLGNSLVSQELVWFLASALLALPVLTLFLAFSSAFAGKKKQPKRKSTASGTQGTKKRSKRDK